MKKDGFTLVELLAVVIILAIISLFVMPKVADLIKSGNNTNTSIIEQKLLAVARTYTNDYDTRFFNRFVNVGYASIITKDELIDAGLVTSDEVALVEDFRGVRVELLDNNKIKYTIARLGDSNDYTLDELYEMIKQLQENDKVITTKITNNNTSGNIFLKSYPVWSIYISISSENPGNIYGGTWEEYGKGRTLVGVDSSDSDFSTVEKLGGSKDIQKHSHSIEATTNDTYIVGNLTFHAAELGVFLYDWNGIYACGSPQTNQYYTPSSLAKVSGAKSCGAITTNVTHKHVINANTNSTGNGDSGNLQPYITTYMWKRTA